MAIDDAVESLAVGVSLPWGHVSSPESIETETTSADFDGGVTKVTAASLAVAEYESVILRSDEEK